MRLFIAEDEAPARDRLIESVGRVAPHARVVGTASSVREVGAWFAANPPPDLLLLDIQLSDGLSLELFADRALTCPTIFTTAYDTFALAAFQAHAIDYLLKPIDEGKLAQAFEKHAGQRRHYIGELAALVETFETRRAPAPAAPRRQRILGRKGTQWVSLAIADVACFVSVDKLTFAVTADGANSVRYLVDAPLADIERDVDPQHFFRATRQTLVNAGAIAGFRAAGKGRLVVALSVANDEITISPERAAAFRAWLAK